MNRINQRFESLRQQGRKALVSYVVMGDPAKDVTLPVMHALVESGTDIIELGIPFSDPNAEGPVIQKAHERALENGTSLHDALAQVKQFRETDSDTPVLLMGYTNPIERMGYD
ncbi:MAG: tryptophan synthase subunit alpha, partial [Porticoccus sp.]